MEREARLLAGGESRGVLGGFSEQGAGLSLYTALLRRGQLFVSDV